MSNPEEKIMKTTVLSFVAGVVIGGAVSAGVFFTIPKPVEGKKSEPAIPELPPALPEKEENPAPEKEEKKRSPLIPYVDVIPPLFTKEDCRQYINYSEYLLMAGYDHTTWDMSRAASLGSLLAKVELYIFVNEKINSLPEEQRKDFIAKYRAWETWYRKELKKPLVDDNGDPLEGTMFYPVYAGTSERLIELYLKKFPDRAKLECDFVANYRKEQQRKNSPEE